MKKLLPILVLAVAAIVVIAVVISRQNQPQDNATTQNASTRNATSASGAEQIAWYGMMPHPYIVEVQSGVETLEKDQGIAINKVVGQEWTQSNENSNVETMATKGYKAFSIYPGDAGGGNRLFEKLTKNGQIVVAYGAEPELPTAASFTVATDIKGAAMQATEELIKFMGDKGNILNVLETVTDINTTKRNEGIQEVVAKHPNVKILQTLADMTQVTQAQQKIEDALTARGDEIDGIITTGYNPTIAAAAILVKWHKDPAHKRIHFVGIDTGPTVIQAIRDGQIDATIAQNPFGHGYISCAVLKLMLDGWTPANGYQYINAGTVLVTKNNIDTYPQEVRKITDSIVADLKTKYLKPPAGK